MAHEELLQILIRIINAQLLKAIIAEVLKPEYIQHTNGVQRFREFFLRIDCHVNALNNSYENRAVQRLCECISALNSHIAWKTRHNTFAVHVDRFLRQRGG